MNKKANFWLIIILALISTGCSSIVKAEQPTVFDSVMLTESNSVGQTFIANFDGMDGIDIYLLPLKTGDGRLQLYLRHDPHNLENLAVVSIPISEISTTGFYHFPFPVQPHSNQEDYYLILKVIGTGSVEVGTATGESYLNGALYQGNQPDDNHQMTFNLNYYIPRLGLGILGEMITWFWYLLAAIFLFVLPGWALMDGLLHRDYGVENIQSKLSENDNASQQNFWIKPGIAIGLSLAVYPILLLWTDLFGLHFGRLYAWGPGLLAVVVIFWRRKKFIKPTLWVNFKLLRNTVPTYHLANIALLLVLGLVVFSRFWVIRNLDFPMWGDSYQHTVIAQLMADNGGLFDSWQPYAEMSTFTYHFGFHSLATVFHWITSIQMPEAVLWVGQILNILAVFTLYPLANRIAKNPWAGIIAVFIAGILTSMPMSYVNWGRYTQLAGLSILLICIYLTWELLERNPLDKRLLTIGWLTWAGLALTHYRVLIFALAFIPAFLLINIREQPIKILMTKIFFLGLGAALISFPWYNNLVMGELLSIFMAYVSTSPQQLTSFEQQYNAIDKLTNYLPITIWLLLIISSIWGILNKIREVFVIVVWWLLILIAANPQWLRLPGSGTLTNFALFIAFYIPASLLISIPISKLIEKYPQIRLEQTSQLKTLVTLIIGICIIILSVWGTRSRLLDVKIQNHALTTPPDFIASLWINENTPTDAHFLVNSFPAYGGSSIVGSDGGWWLPISAQRKTTLPPLTYVSEEGPIPDYRVWINELINEILSKGITHPNVLAMLSDRGVTHVYIGQQQGSVNNPFPPLEPEQLLADPHFQPVYNSDRVWIFEFLSN